MDKTEKTRTGSKKMMTGRFIVLLGILILGGCAELSQPEMPEDPPLTLKPASFADLPGWSDDSVHQALPALKASCERIMKRPSDAAFGPLEQAGTYEDWRRPCNWLVQYGFEGNTDLRAFLESEFQPWQAFSGHSETGLFTGYYEASLRGARTKQGPYQYPLHARPDDLVMVDLGEFRDSLKGERIAGRVQDGRLKPYEDRGAIVRGEWPHNDKVLVWVDDPVDAFFVQIQGSGVVELEDGSVMRIGYAGQNGHVYYAIGRELIARGYLTKDNVSMQSIRAWLEAHPEEAGEIMNTNRSYVFFKEMEQEGAVGGEGVVLTAGRSLAVDRSKIPYGVPLWVDIKAPVQSVPAIRRLMVAQDTGGAIRGAIRGDVFWGYGPRAEEIAGIMKSRGRYWVLLPKR